MTDLDSLPPSCSRWLATAIRERTAVWRRNGLEPPAELLALADRLYPPPNRDAAPDPKARARLLAAARSRRYRARQRGEDVPLHRSGRPKNVTIIAA